MSKSSTTEVTGGEKLRLVDGKDLLNCFDLDNNLLFDEQINSIPHFDSDSVIDDGKDLLGFEIRMHLVQLVAETFVIRPFQQARTKSRMDSVGGTDNAVGGSAVDEFDPVLVRGRVLRGSAFGEQERVRI
jgi:hypothetical protein